MNANDKNRGFTFIGDGGDLFVIYLINILLTIVTLGIYSFWAKVKVTRFLYSNTRYLDEPFDYHATGLERFIGFLKALGIFAVIMAVLWAGNYWLTRLFGPKASIILFVTLYITILAAIPFIIVGKERFRQSRSSYKAIRFRFTGRPKELAMVFLKGLGLTIVTLGVYAPWFYCNLRKYFITYSHYGTQAFDFHGNGRMLVKTFFLGLFLTIITLGIYGFWWNASLFRFVWGNTSIQGKRFSSSITGGQIFKNTIISIILVIFSFGIGYPWAIIRIIRMYIVSLDLEEGLDFAAIKADFDKKASALADGLDSMADALDTVGSMMP